MKKNRIAIVGLGYVGLPLARLFATKYQVVGFDINKKRVNEINSGVDSTLEISNDELSKVLVTGFLKTKKGLLCSSKIEDISDCTYYIVTVPTPVDKNNRPVLTPLYKASETIAKVLKIGDTVITNEAVTAVSATTVILIIVGVALFLFISYRKREQIKIQARRASTFIRRTTKKLRATISGK